MFLFDQYLSGLLGLVARGGAVGGAVAPWGRHSAAGFWIGGAQVSDGVCVKVAQVSDGVCACVRKLRACACCPLLTLWSPQVEFLCKRIFVNGSV